MSKRKRFIILDDEQLAKKSKEQVNKNTEKSDKRADRAFRNFLVACGRAENDCDYWDFTPESLDDYLAKFWFGARKYVNGQSDEEESQEVDENNPDANEKSRMYSANSLKNYRYALNRLIKKYGSGMDIVSKNNILFKKSNHVIAL